MVLPLPMLNNDELRSQENHLRAAIEADQEKLTLARIRYQVLQTNQAMLRIQSRRQWSAALPTKNEALREVDAFIFTLEFRVKKNEATLRHVRGQLNPAAWA
ncbi:MAG: hypothetical protein H0X24_06190 [Ktedonobacterales bacterium]|nr:hypothetical protein [Ktedonobacterales bacterium]